MLLLCLRLLHGSVATKRMHGRKFFHHYIGILLRSCAQKNYENPSISVKVAASQWPLFYVDMV